MCNRVGTGEVIKCKKGRAHEIVKACYLDTRMKEMFLVSAQEHSHRLDLKGVHSSHTVALSSKVLV